MTSHTPTESYITFHIFLLIRHQYSCYCFEVQLINRSRHNKWSRLFKKKLKLFLTYFLSSTYLLEKLREYCWKSMSSRQSKTKHFIVRFLICSTECYNKSLEIHFISWNCNLAKTLKNANTNSITLKRLLQNWSRHNFLLVLRSFQWT